MKFILSLSVLLVALGAFATDQDLINHKALNAAKSLYSMNISSQTGAAHFSVSKEACEGEDGTQICVIEVVVKERNPVAGVTSYKVTFMNDQLQKLEQNCNYCF